MIITKETAAELYRHYCNMSNIHSQLALKYQNLNTMASKRHALSAKYFSNRAVEMIPYM